jgi:hypothetical protein
VKAGEVRIRWARAYVAGAALVGCAGILLLARSFNFYFDEWDFILHAPDWTFASYLEPHNEHPAMLARVIYAILLSTAGLRTYLPYMVVLLAVHALNVVLLFEVVRRRAGDVVGIAAALLLLVLGAGWENLLWAFQVTFVGSVACGLGALLVLEQPRAGWSMPAATALVTASIMFSGIGLFFAVAAGVRLALEPERRGDLGWLLPVGVAVLVWYVAIGRSGLSPNPPPTAHNLVAAPVYAVWGIGEAAAGLVGEGAWWGPVGLLAGVGVLAWTWWRRRPDAFALGAAAALVSFYLVTGLSRAQLGYEQSGAGRYVYEGAVFWLLLLGDAARALPWRGTWRPALAACLFLACFNSGVLLFEFAAAKTAQMQREAADLQALNAARNDPCLGANARADAYVMPQVARPALYYRAVDRYGNPAPPGPVSDVADYTQARSNLDRTGCR